MLAIMENRKMAVAPQKHPRAKYPITEPPQVWVCDFPIVDGNGKLVSASMETGENCCNSPKSILEQNYQLLTP